MVLALVKLVSENGGDGGGSGGGDGGDGRSARQANNLVRVRVCVEAKSSSSKNNKKGCRREALISASVPRRRASDGCCDALS